MAEQVISIKTNRLCCRKHKSPDNVLGEKLSSIVCRVDGCNRIVTSQYRSYCLWHLRQWKKNGRVSSYNRMVRNNYYIDDDKCFIELRNKHGELVATTIIDAVFAPKALEYKWRVRHGYAVAHLKSERKSIQLHKFITGYPMTDHINMNKLDNRLANLRPCDHSINALNTAKKKPVAATSKYRGVSFDRESKKYRAAIQYKGKKYHVGRFTHEYEAAKAYNELAKKLHGKLAKLNDIHEEL